jgi:hypothetical protein
MKGLAIKPAGQASGKCMDVAVDLLSGKADHLVRALDTPT